METLLEPLMCPFRRSFNLTVNMEVVTPLAYPNCQT